MANKKRSSGQEKTFLEKLSDQAAHVKEELIAGKDHLVEVAGDTIASVKSGIREFKARKARKIAKKAVGPKKQVKKRVKKVARKMAKKSLPAKKVIRKKSAKPAKKLARKTKKK
jgi:hypothetical protein